MKPQSNDGLRPEYPEELIRSGEKGKYAKKYQAQTNIIVVDDDLVDQFPNSDAVNDALRDYLELRKKTAT